MNINLQKATSEDTQLIYQLAKKIWTEHYVPIIGQDQVNYMLDRMYSHEGLKEQMEKKGHIFYLVLWDENPIGFISISGDVDKFIHKFYIDTSEQNKGLGTLVFEMVKQMYPDTNSYTLTVNRQNFKAINFYFKNEFIINHVDDFDIGDGFYMNDFIMKWQKH